MKKIALGLIVLLLAADVSAAHKMSCRKRKQKTKTAKTAIPVMKSVLMGRTGCFGTCPVYELEVFATGLLRYTGKSNVPERGVFEKKISATETTALLDRFAAYRPDTCSPLYRLKIADLPGIRYVITYKDSAKTINNADAGPAFLKQMAREFDGLGGVDASWKKVKELPQN